MSTYIVWEAWSYKNPEFDNVTDAYKKAYAMATKKRPKPKTLINVAKSMRKNQYDVHWRYVGELTLADGKKKVVVMDAKDRTHLLKPNGEIGEAVRNKRIIRDGKVIGDMPYVGQLPERGVFYNYDTEKYEPFLKKRK